MARHPWLNEEWTAEELQAEANGYAIQAAEAKSHADRQFVILVEAMADEWYFRQHHRWWRRSTWNRDRILGARERYLAAIARYVNARTCAGRLRDAATGEARTDG